MSLRIDLGQRREKITGDMGTLYNVELGDLYALPNIIQTIKSKRMRWVRYVLCTGKKRKAYSVFVGKPETKSHMKVFSTDRRIMLK
jgi:hypothetical protein